MELSFITALTIGLLGSTHCIGMCGGIVGALNTGLQQNSSTTRRSQFAYHLTYNAGRILSYSIAGAVAGLVGAQTTKIPLDTVISIGGLIAGAFMVALGVHLAGWWHSLAPIEKAGQTIWKYIQPLGKRFLPVRNPIHAFGLGMVWGWLPCGLVYSALALSVFSSSAPQGALLMFGFGLGTLPALLAMGKAYGFLRNASQSSTLRRLAGITVILIGLFTAIGAITGHNHHHAASSSLTKDGITKAGHASDSNHAPSHLH